MTEPPRRPILRLKNPPPVAKTPRAWRCKPCGAPVEVAETLADEDEVRCPACNAHLGTADQFRSDPPRLQRIRARLVGG